MDKKVILFPGWMKSVGYYDCYPGQEIWQRKFKSEEVTDADYIVGHSLGCSYALRALRENRQAKFVFINPLLPRKNFIVWAWRWLKFAFAGGVRRDERMLLSNLPGSILEFIKIAGTDLLETINTIGKDRFVILRGVKDEYFCDNFSVECLKREGVRYVEIAELGHEWDERYKEEIIKIIDNYESLV